MARYPVRRQKRWHQRPPLTATQLREERWRNQVYRMLRFLGTLKHERALHGEKWKARMTTYYVGRLRPLLENPPRGLEAEAKDFLSKLEKL